MAVLQLLRLDGEALFRIPDHQVGIVAGSNRALLFFQSGELSGSAAHPACQMLERIFFGAHFCPHRGQSQLQGSDASPGLEKIARANAFHGGRRRRVVGYDKVERALAQRFPEFFTILSIADGRRAFVLRASLGNRGGGEKKIVRARFCGNSQPRFSRALQERHGSFG